MIYFPKIKFVSQLKTLNLQFEKLNTHIVTRTYNYIGSSMKFG